MAQFILQEGIFFTFFCEGYSLLLPATYNYVVAEKIFCLLIFYFDFFFYIRTPTWFKSILSPLKKSESGPVFRFFMDLNDSGILLKKCFVFFICLMHYEFSIT
jgi:hypothetical protein